MTETEQSQEELLSGEETCFVPSDEHIRCKAVYWVRARTNERTDRPSLEDAIRTTGDHRLRSYWKNPAFVDWFCNSTSYEEEMEFIKMLLPAYLLEVLNTEPGPGQAPSYKVSAAKLASELLGLIGGDKAGDKDGKKVPKTKEELRKFIRQRAPGVLKAIDGGKQ